MIARRHLRLACGLAMGLSLCVVAQVLAPACAQEGDSASLNPLTTLDKASLKGFLERPLFDPARALPPVVPPPVVVAAPIFAAPPEPPPTLHLLGVIHGRRDMAIVHKDSDEKALVLHTGDRVGAWTVTVMPPVGVRLRDGDRSFDYALFGKPGAVAVPVAGASPAPDGSSDAVAAMAARNARLQRRTY